MTIAPRPFLQLARRCWRLRIDVPRGYLAGMGNAPWYYQRRRRSRFALSRDQLHTLSQKRQRRARPATLARRARRPLVYFVCEVA